MTELLIRYPQLNLCRQEITKAADMMENTYKNGGKLLLCGNGGSCADCEHIAGELLKSFRIKRPVDSELKGSLCDLYEAGDADLIASSLERGIPCVSLPSMIAANTAYINDVKPDMVYAQLTYALGSPKDMLIGISTSGESKNIVNALMVARAMGMATLALTGNKSDTLCAKYADTVILAPASETYLIQELHLPIYHYLCAEVERRVFG